jgi:lipoate-protein ligase A
LLYSLVLTYGRAPPLAEINPSYHFILDCIQLYLSGLAPKVEQMGTSDLAVGGRKFSGSAQQRKRAHLLHHGTLLYAFDLEQVGRYLHLPVRQPAYRAGRNHLDFLMNLPACRAELVQRFRSAWYARTELPTWPEKLVRDLVAGKYGKEEWIRRK